jgi:hypothetical protein
MWRRTCCSNRSIGPGTGKLNLHVAASSEAAEAGLYLVEVRPGVPADRRDLASLTSAPRVQRCGGERGQPVDGVRDGAQPGGRAGHPAGAGRGAHAAVPPGARHSDHVQLRQPQASHRTPEEWAEGDDTPALLSSIS